MRVPPRSAYCRAGLGWGDAQLQQLAAVLPHYEQLTSLHVGGNPFGDSGLAALARALRAPAMRRVRHLDLSGGGFGDAGVRALSVAIVEGALTQLTRLHLAPRGGLGCGAMEDLAYALSLGGVPAPAPAPKCAPSVTSPRPICQAGAPQGMRLQVEVPFRGCKANLSP